MPAVVKFNIFMHKTKTFYTMTVKNTFAFKWQKRADMSSTDHLIYRLGCGIVCLQSLADNKYVKSRSYDNTWI